MLGIWTAVRRVARPVPQGPRRGPRDAPRYHVILVVDIHESSRPDRTDRLRLELCDTTYGLLEEALAAIGLHRRLDYRTVDRGDGVLVLLRGDVVKVRLLDELVPRLAGALDRRNRAHPCRAELRLRLALHAGEVLPHRRGWAGGDLSLACRLLDGDPLRQALAASGAPLAVVVSEPIYQGVVRHGYAGIRAEDYHEVGVIAKGTRARAWVHVPPVPTEPDIHS